ncbi:putative tartrate:succinate antiporter [Klebsiella grimontii]|uniref:Putative tartrate:succinate antiporter n=1 Tax=Klebsiella grimontii TaxID=2058152 RepID=A0A7H4P2W3_9ENTR|nr:putative tartrate:succinate antiporter [Klebsiella grimontii]
MFAAGYDKTQFGRRLALILVKYLGRRSLTLGYAITFADLLLAPFTPSNTARSGGTIYRLSLTCRRCTALNLTTQARAASAPT